MLAKIPYSVSRINATEKNPNNPKAYRNIYAERKEGDIFDVNFDFNNGKFGIAGCETMSAGELRGYINRLNNPVIDVVSY